MILGIRLLQIWPHSVVCVHNYYGEVSFPGKNTNLIIEIIILCLITASLVYCLQFEVCSKSRKNYLHWVDAWGVRFHETPPWHTMKEL